jgi:uncharacterized protein (TIGR02266 family)
MDRPIRNVLVAGLEPVFYRRLEPVLRRSNFDVDRVPYARTALDLIQDISFDVLVFGHPLAGADLEDVLDAVNSEGSPCRSSAILLLTTAERLPALAAHCEGDRVRALCLDASEDELQSEVSSLLRVAPRLSVRITIRLAVQLADGSTELLSQTENVSLGGMLVRTPRPYPVDAEVAFELFLPGRSAPVTGEGRVVRHAADERGRLSGLGVRFVRFDDDGRHRLQSFLDTP